MRLSISLLCGVALAACASNKASERSVEERPVVENWNEPDSPMSAESVKENGDPSPDPTTYDRDGDGHPDNERVRADRARRPAADGDGENAAKAEKRDEPVAADNTGVNERDEQPGALTPTDQGESDSDLKITQQIREAVVDDDSLSFTAKNVKIITQDGKVTLRGPVKSAHERTAIGAAAKKVAPGRVDNQLEVAD